MTTRHTADAEPDPQAPRIRPFLRSPPPGGEWSLAFLPATPQVPEPPAPRPFVLTAGRVAGADPAIGLETQVTALPEGDRWALAGLAPELRAIVALCAEPISVAEISAQTRMHFGVTRVLVGDLRAAGHLEVHVDDADAHDPDLILRVIDGLRAIC